jgi:predicted dehydrogenase
MNAPLRLSRRQWLATASLAAGSWAASSSLAQPARAANERLRFACIGVGGRGRANLETASKFGDIVALCDVDDQILGQAAAAHPAARKEIDFRKLLENSQDNFDAVVISTPDHTHAVIALMALRNGHHVYCEKPLCRYLAEARILAEVARKSKLVTQLGNQSSANPKFRRAVECVREGMIGAIREVHVWSNVPQWPTGPGTKPAMGACPPTFHWNEFVGPAELTDYSPDYCASKWHAWWRFGNGALGDQAAHSMNAAYHACELRNPVSVEAQHSGHDRISYPKSSFIRWNFAATPKRDPVTLFWYDGGRKPDASLFGSVPISAVGCLLRGDEGTMVSTSLFTETWNRIPSQGEEELTRSAEYIPLAATEHFSEFVDAIRGNGVCMSNFPDVAGPFTETILLGNLALLHDGKLEWDAANLRPKNAKGLEADIRPTYRPGYTL